MLNLTQFLIISQGLILFFTTILLYKFLINKKLLKNEIDKTNKLVFKLANSYEENNKLESKIISLSDKRISSSNTNKKTETPIEKTPIERSPRPIKKPRTTKKTKE
jgi:hypothetical protein